VSNSHLEAAFEHWWKLLAPKDLPAPLREQKLIPGRKHQIDFSWPALKVAVEVDGGQHAYKGGRHNTDADRWKINKLSELGYRILRYSGTMIDNDPEAMIEQVAKVVREAITKSA